MCGPVPFLIMSVAGAAISMYGSIQAGKANRAANELNAEEQTKQIEVARLQTEDEEVRRRQETLYMNSENLAASAASGALSSSETFRSINENNTRTANRDIGLIRVNGANRRGQMSTQRTQYKKAGKAAYQQGVIGAAGTMFNAGASISSGLSSMGGLGKLGGG